MPSLTVKNSPVPISPSSIPLSSDLITIGRSPENTVRISHNTISRKHAEIVLESGQILLRDLGSTNGVFLNGKKILEGLLHPGDVIGLGSLVEFTVSNAPDPAKLVADDYGGLNHGVLPPKKKLTRRGQTYYKWGWFALLAISVLFAIGILYLRSMDKISQKIAAPGTEHTAKVSKAPPSTKASEISLNLVLETSVQHTIQAVKFYREKSYSRAKESFDLAIDQLYAYQMTFDAQENPEQYDYFKIIIPALPVGFRSTDIKGMYEDLLRRRKRSGVQIHKVRREEYIRSGLEMILENFGEDIATVPDQFFQRVLYYIDFFTSDSKRRGWYSRSLERSYRYKPLIREIFKEYNIPYELGYIALIESGYSPTARSRAGAVGMWQFMPRTARDYGLKVSKERDDRTDPELSTKAAARYIKNLLFDFGPRAFMLAMAAYNAGEGRIRGQLRKGKDPFKQRSFWHLSKQGLLPEETQEYVPKVLASAIIAERPEYFGFNPPQTPKE